MEFWIKNNQCTGCGACANACPKKAITMIEDDCGFIHPHIDKKKCIDCGLCKKTCPVLEKKVRNNLIDCEVYAGWSKDKNIRFTSTSGGIFTEIAKQIIDLDGVVIGAKYNDEILVEHDIATTNEELEKLKQSKYLQSNPKDIYIKTRTLLNQNKLVAFCGSPCQIAGLYKYLKKDYENLLTIEFICRGMNSPKAYKAWLSEIELQENKKVTKVWFKYKEHGWNLSPKCTRLDFKDGTHKVYSDEENLFMCGYLNCNLYIRPSCGDCKFNGLPRQADITLADFWKIDKELDDDKGTSMILINTSTGKKYFEKIKNSIFFERKDINSIIKGNECFSKSVSINKKSKEFLSSLNDNNFSHQYKKYGKISLTKKILRKAKNIVKKIIKR